MSLTLAPRAPFQPLPDATWEPSEELRLIALQRRRVRLLSPTEPEIAFQRILHGLGLQQWTDYEPEVVAFYPKSFVIFDFLCQSRGVAFEVDGGVHFDQRPHDAGRDQYFLGQGIRTVRFRNRFVMGQAEVCARVVAKELGLPR
jgi:Protein of unknown function (DUF559)